ncbi:MAG: cytochrome b N-terminal domain-containing protein [Ignavibacteriales bacterium]|nr:cytochrome b N-terminal domain-containing protein [Ignavibacteriales bacterium]
MPMVETTKKLYKRLTWTWNPGSEKEAGDAIVKNLLLHWFPNKISKESLSWSYSLWLGTISFVLFIILVVTGVVLMFLYVPSVERAYSSIKDIEFVVSFGWLLRSMHRISAHLMVAAVFLHMIRVFLTGAYKNGIAVGSNRPLNWIIGIALFILTLLLSFTGYLLPWDQLAFWAITVGTNIASAAPVVGDWIRFVLLGGSTIDQNALIRFYVLHVFFLPMMVLLLFSYHMWRVRKDGGLAVADKEASSMKPEAQKPVKSKTYSLLGITNGTSVHVRTVSIDEEKNSVASSPHLIRRIWIVSLLTFLSVLILSVIFRAPLEAPANPSVTPNPAKAPWYFLWLQELVTITTVKLGSFTINGALVGGILLPTALLGLAIWWPYRDRSGVNSVGVWFARERSGQNYVFIGICLFIIVLTIVGTFLRGPYWNFYWPWEQWPTMPVKF